MRQITEIDRDDFRNLLVEISQAHMPFGKFGIKAHPPSGVPLMDLPVEYLAWFKERGFPKGRLGELMAHVYEIKEVGMDSVFDQFESQGGATRNVLNAAVFIAPNNPVCLLAGIAAMPWKKFLLIAVSGTVARIALMRGIGSLFSDQIEELLDVVARYQRWFTLGSLLLVGAYVAYQVIGRRGLVGGVESLEDELGDD
jgi:uncharacterized protein (DUF3820 family)